MKGRVTARWLIRLAAHRGDRRVLVSALVGGTYFVVFMVLLPLVAVNVAVTEWMMQLAAVPAVVGLVLINFGPELAAIWVETLRTRARSHKTRRA